MQLTEAQVTTVMYESDRTGKTSSRVIIPVSVPADVVKAIDVDDLLPSERMRMENLVRGYTQYRDSRAATVFSFEDWVAHTQDTSVEPQWRTFKLSGLQ